MRYLSLLLIVLAMWWTWSATHTPAVISEAEHARVQSELKDVIRNYITTNLPTAKNVQFNSFWTRTLDPQTIRASFSYSFDDNDTSHGAAHIGIDGYAILDHKAATADEDVWSLDKLNITGDHYIFLNGEVVNPGTGSSAK